MSVPVGLQFGSNPGAISVQDTGHTLTPRAGDFLNAIPFERQPTSGFQVASGQTLALIGGEISAKGGILTAEQGHIALGSVRSPDLVRLIPTAQGYEFSYDDVSSFGDIQLSQRSLLDVSGSPAGSMQIQARQITLQNGSLALLQNSGASSGGSLTVVATESIQAEGSTVPSPLNVLATGFNPTVGSGFYSETLNGQGGNVRLSAPQISFMNDGRVSSRTAIGTGNAGSITVITDRLEAGGGVSFAGGSSGIFSLTAGQGRGGTVSISSSRINLLNGGVISAGSSGDGDGAEINVTAQDIWLTGTEGSGFSTISSLSRARGDSGNLRIETRTLTMDRGGSVGTGTLGSGSAGSVEINASERVEVLGQNVLRSGTQSFATPTRIDSSALVFAAPGLPRTVPSGDAGSIVINTPQLRVTDYAEVSVRNEGTGRGGRLTVNADRIQVESSGTLSALTFSGSGGDIALTARELLLMRDRAQIRTDSRGERDGGNITINAPVIVGLDNSDIFANAVGGRGGNIAIATQALFGLGYRNLRDPQAVSTNDISARSEANVSGNVTITTPGVDPNSGLVELSQDILDDDQTVALGCAAPQNSQFVITGRGGMPQAPTQTVTHGRPWSDVRAIAPSQSTNTSALRSDSSVLIEATSWQRNATGKIELTAGKYAATTDSATCAN